ncbi:MAG: hypothetical protein LBF28_02990 [Rickettsiales bacterium]|nr:hypothetical protein [Rickettsiales bacterium]
MSSKYNKKLDIAKFTKNLPKSYVISDLVEKTVEPFLSEEDKRRIQDNDKRLEAEFDTENLLLRALGIGFFSATPFGVIGLAAESSSTVGAALAMAFVVTMLQFIYTSVEKSATNEYEIEEFRQKIYRKYPQAKEILKDVESAQAALSKLQDKKNYSR